MATRKKEVLFTPSHLKYQLNLLLDTPGNSAIFPLQPQPNRSDNEAFGYAIFDQLFIFVYFTSTDLAEDQIQTFNALILSFFVRSTIISEETVSC